MRSKSVAAAFIASLLLGSALTPIFAADMTQERALNPQREPQNWILHLATTRVIASHSSRRSTPRR
jgi:hypothetical protein